MDSYQRKIVDYYQDCEYQYKSFWHLDSCLSLHYGFWDSSTKNLKEALLKINEIIASKANLQSSDRVLDVGCGVGGTLIYLAEKFGTKGHGISIAPTQVEKAKKHSIQHSVSAKVTFSQSDYMATSLPEACFDVVIALESAFYAQNNTDFLGEAYRLLKKGGRLIIADIFRTKSSFDQKNESVIRSLTSAWAINAYTTSTNYLKEMKQAKFKDLSEEDITENILPTAKRLFGGFFLGIGPAKLGQLLGYRNSKQVNNVLSCLYQYQAFKKGLIRYKILTGEK